MEQRFIDSVVETDHIIASLSKFYPGLELLHEVFSSGKKFYKIEFRYIDRAQKSRWSESSIYITVKVNKEDNRDWFVYKIT